MYEKINEMPELYIIFARKITKYPNFLMIFARKVKKIFEFHVIFARQMPEFYVIIALNIFPIFLGGRAPLPPVSYAYGYRRSRVEDY